MKRNRLARRPLLLLLSLLMLLGIFSTASAEESTNLLQNPGFEEIGADGLPVGWKTDAYLNLEGVTFYTVSDNAMSGAHSVQIENLDYNDARFCQTVAVEPSSFYRLSGYVKAWDTLDEGLGGNLSIKDVYVFSESVYDSPDEWQYVELYGVTDTDQHEVTVYARLGGYSGESFGTAMFDDLSLVKVDAPPEGIVASRWYQPTAAVQDDPSDDLADTAAASPAWPWMTAVGIAYVALGVYLLRFLQKKNAVPLDAKKREAMPLFAIIGLIIAAAARLIVANSVSGYQVDVNCFLAWGNTLLSVGPANFYQTTNFCDYPPAYVYIMGLNAALMRVLPLSAAAVHKLIPMACDLVAAVLTYRIARKKNASANQAGILMLLMAAGARMAEPGEFTYRAFMNGRIDLAQAEGVMRMIRAGSERAMRSAVRQMEGGVSAFVRTARAEITSLLAAMAAAIDFPDEVEETQTALNRAVYAYAEQLAADGQKEAAATEFYSLGTYQDAAERGNAQE